MSWGKLWIWPLTTTFLCALFDCSFLCYANILTHTALSICLVMSLYNGNTIRARSIDWSADLVNPKGHHITARCLFLAVCTKYVTCHQCSSLQIIMGHNCDDGKGQNYTWMEVRKYSTEHNVVKRKLATKHITEVIILLLIPVSALVYVCFRSSYILAATEILRSGHFSVSARFRWRQFLAY
jgi:hypothetical protein